MHENSKEKDHYSSLHLLSKLGWYKGKTNIAYPIFSTQNKPKEVKYISYSS